MIDKERSVVITESLRRTAAVLPSDAVKFVIAFLEDHFEARGVWLADGRRWITELIDGDDPDQYDVVDRDLGPERPNDRAVLATIEALKADYDVG